MTKKMFRVLVAKPGLDGHDRGAKIVCKALRDAGFEVIYTGLRNRPEQIVSTAIQEDVDIIGLSILSGAHKKICQRVTQLLKEHSISDIYLFVGGIIPDDDIPVLKEMGIDHVFCPGTSTELIIDTIKRILDEPKHSQLASNIG